MDDEGKGTLDTVAGGDINWLPVAVIARHSVARDTDSMPGPWHEVGL